MVPAYFIELGANCGANIASPFSKNPGRRTSTCRPARRKSPSPRCDLGVRGILDLCADYGCSHSVAMSADRWPDDVRLSDIEGRFTCTVCGHRGADVGPDFNWKEKPVRWDTGPLGHLERGQA
jgi:hypothetical protein